MTLYEDILREYKPQCLSLGEVILYEKTLKCFESDTPIVMNALDLLGLLREVDLDRIISREERLGG